MRIVRCGSQIAILAAANGGKAMDALVAKIVYRGLTIATLLVGGHFMNNSNLRQFIAIIHISVENVIRTSTLRTN